MDNAMLAAEMRQVQAKVAKLSSEREVWIRVAAVLVGYIKNKSVVPMLGEDLVVRRGDFDAVPKEKVVAVKSVKVRMGDDPNGEEEDALVVEVRAKPETPLLAIPNGRLV